jgi:hypothetical protein
MIADPLPFSIEDLQAENDRDRPRSDGIHQGALIKRIVRVLDPKRFGSEDAPDPATLELGFIWEEVLSRGLAARHRGWRQLELVHNGIVRTLDGYSTDEDAILESKATKISAREHITSARFQHWHMQTMGYATAMETDTAILKVLHINGDYEKVKFGVPIPRAWRLRFTEREMRENERQLERERDECLEELRRNAK